MCVLYVCDIFALTLPSACAVRSDLPRKCLVALLLATHTLALLASGLCTEEKGQDSVKNTNALCYMVHGFKQALVHLHRGSLDILLA